MEAQAKYECPECWGKRKDCPTCEGTGWWAVHRCPRQIMDPKAFEVCLYAAGQFGDHLPVAGGVLDQCATFVAALRLAKSEMHGYQQAEAKHG